MANVDGRTFFGRGEGCGAGCIPVARTFGGTGRCARRRSAGNIHFAAHGCRKFLGLFVAGEAGDSNRWRSGFAADFAGGVAAVLATNRAQFGSINIDGIPVGAGSRGFFATIGLRKRKFGLVGFGSGRIFGGGFGTAGGQKRYP